MTTNYLIQGIALGFAIGAGAVWIADRDYASEPPIPVEHTTPQIIVDPAPTYNDDIRARDGEYRESYDACRARLAIGAAYDKSEWLKANMAETIRKQCRE
jgi:hypothetical protein